MSILIQCICVVTCRKAIEDKYPGGLKEYSKMPYVWYDDFAVCSSYMNFRDVDTHLNHLAKIGIVLSEQGSNELAVVSQNSGILSKTDTIQFAKRDGCSIAWIGNDPGITVFPQEWEN